ncbi:glycoside hydrolase family 3 N-terminal domain-containing protein [Methylomicrobium sp. Wu6]|uniref:glycoside hydrolase family 3 N-terminal domain-containing protein n=1 Tax=Methylomicrobium sp. Wu6 TaxID=3107928 RepID=UPI002DD61F95|nr:glycoside hydrolase family 3 N-terminal domain-containing protein [Methylomicrobium sp. Wu6]MEC4748489.1 glycoside hydrolase family 3 N-terminal domain-containing protein [Methylomicrobium sp. Wu6]
MSAQTEKPNIVSQVDHLLAQMTLEEKVGQMTQVDFTVIGVQEELNKGEFIDPTKLEDAVLRRHVGSIMNAPFTPKNKALPPATWCRMQESIQAVSARSRLKIPVLYGIDAIHGATYTQNATLFPQAISMAATFNPDLSFKAGEITAREIRASGIRWNFSPMLDIGRQPLWPRLWETYGEDVHLATVMGTRYIEGHQGADFSAADKGLTCLKHYVGYSLPFNGKDRTPAFIGERTLREYFLPTFAAGIKAGAPTVMVNSSEVDGIPGHANRHYLTTILREELGFKGFTVSDWEDIKRLYTRDKLAASEKEAVKIAVMAGVDMSMVPFDFSFYDILVELVKSGEVPIARIDEAVGRILTVKYQAGLFAPSNTPIAEEGNFATPEATAANRQAAHEAIILAKNGGHLLPLKKDAKILVTGPTANLLSVMNGGWTITWQGDAEQLYPKDKLTVVGALQKQSTGKVTYVGGKRFDDPIDIAKVIEEAKHHDVILLCLGEPPYTETVGNIPTLDLAPEQLALADAVLATGKPVILLTFGGRPRIITPIAEKAAAVLLGFLPGMEGGLAVADILYGDYNPDAKIPITYPRATNDIMMYDYKPIESYELNTYNPLYPFGHGLSYTTFETGNLRVDKTSIGLHENISVGVDVKNTGKLAGKETVLVYLNDAAASVTRPNKQLKAFKKIALEPGETQRLNFTLTPDDLSFIGLDLKRIVEPGDFNVMVGNQSVKFTVRP